MTLETSYLGLNQHDVKLFGELLVKANNNQLLALNHALMTEIHKRMVR